MGMTSYCLVIKANGYTAHSANDINYLENNLICINKSGYIVKIYSPDDEAYCKVQSFALDNGLLYELKPGQYLLPGFIDLHIHAPQWVNMGKALDRPLEQWLQEYTFPLESRYADLNFAKENYQHLVHTLLANGTTTAVYFATIHREASIELGRICLALGQRALIGKVSMDDREFCPEYYRDDSSKSAIEETRLFINQLRELSGNEENRILPVITPRFVPTCTPELLAGLGELARETNCHVQTHCSESDWEHNFVISRYGITDSHVLNDFGLMTRKTILAHGNFITDDDMDLIRNRHSGIAHCPLSNFYLPIVYSLYALLLIKIFIQVWALIFRQVTALQFLKHAVMLLLPAKPLMMV